MKYTIAALTVCLFSPILLTAQTTPAPAAPAAAPVFKKIVDTIDLKDGDTFVFLGDSITHQCLYTQYVEDYFYTRYPNRHIHFHNSGVGGDRANDALVRFDDDVASFKPKYVSILLGMNDGSYRDFDKGIFDTYQKDMTTVLDKIEALGATAIPMTPTMHDARAARLRNKPAEPRDTYYNGVLALYGAWLREEAQVRGLGFVDMYSPLNNIIMTQRKKDPNFILIPDAVHPGPPGHVIMAVAVIEDMVQHGPVSAITVQDKAGKLAAAAVNGKVSDFQATDDKITFAFQANALPWVLPEEAVQGYKLTHAGHHYSNEKVTFRNLKPGKYELKIDGQSVGTWTDGQLAFGAELEENAKTPEYQQALEVATLNKERNDKAVHPLRNWWSQMKGKRREIAKLEQAKDPQLDAKKEAFAKWTEEFKAGVAKQLALCKEYEDKIYTINLPKLRQYELTRVP